MKDYLELKGDFIKIQCVLPVELDEELRRTHDVIKMERSEKLLKLTVQGEAEMVIPVIEKKKPVYCETFPLSLEEIFISEMEAGGYE